MGQGWGGAVPRCKKVGGDTCEVKWPMWISMERSIVTCVHGAAVGGAVTRCTKSGERYICHTRNLTVMTSGKGKGIGHRDRGTFYFSIHAFPALFDFFPQCTCVQV